MFRQYLKKFSSITSIGVFIYYLDCKLSAIDARPVESRIQSIITEQKCKAIDGTDVREIELKNAIEILRAEIRREKRWF